MAKEVLGDLLINIRGDTQQLIKSFNRAESTVKKTSVTMVKSIAGITAGYLALDSAVGSVSAFVRLSDQATGLSSRLNIAVDSTKELSKAQKELFETSQDTRTQLATNIDTFTKLKLASRDFNIEQEKLLKISEILAKTSIIGGGSQESIKAALTQLGQAFSADFQAVGQEIASIREQTPRLFTAIIDGLGVTGKEFKKLAEDGELSTEKITEALLTQKDIVDKEFGLVQLKISEGWTKIGNVALQAIGKINSVSNIDSNIAKVLSDIADALSENIDEITTYTRNLVAFSQVAKSQLDLIFTVLAGGTESIIIGFDAIVTKLSESLGKASIPIFKLLNTIQEKLFDLGFSDSNKLIDIESYNLSIGKFTQKLAVLQKELIDNENDFIKAARESSVTFSERIEILKAEEKAQQDIQDVQRRRIKFAKDLNKQNMSTLVSIEEMAEAEEQFEELNKQTEKSLKEQAKLHKENLKWIEEQNDEVEDFIKYFEDLEKQLADLGFSGFEKEFNDLKSLAEDLSIDFSEVLAQKTKGELKEAVGDALTEAIKSGDVRGALQGLTQSAGDILGNTIGTSLGGAFGGVVGGALGSAIGGSLFGKSDTPSAQEVANSRLEDIFKELETQTSHLEDLGFGGEGKKAEFEINSLTKDIQTLTNEISKNQEAFNIAQNQFLSYAGGGVTGDSSEKTGEDRFSIGRKLQEDLLVMEGLEKQLEVFVTERNKITEKNQSSFEDLFKSEDELLKEMLEIAGSTGEIPATIRELESVMQDLKKSNGLLSDEELKLLETLKDRIDESERLKKAEIEAAKATENLKDEIADYAKQNKELAQTLQTGYIARFADEVNLLISEIGEFLRVRENSIDFINEINGVEKSYADLVQQVSTITDSNSASSALNAIKDFYSTQITQAESISNIEKENINSRIDLLEREDDVIRSLRDYVDDMRISQLANEFQTTALASKFQSAFNDLTTGISGGDIDIGELGNRATSYASSYLSSLEQTAQSEADFAFERARVLAMLEGVQGTEPATLDTLQDLLGKQTLDTTEIKELTQSLLDTLDRNIDTGIDSANTEITALKDEAISLLGEDSAIVRELTALNEKILSQLSTSGLSLSELQSILEDSKLNTTSSQEYYEEALQDLKNIQIASNATDPTIYNPDTNQFTTSIASPAVPVVGGSGSSAGMSPPTFNPQTTDGITTATTTGFTDLASVYESVLGRGVDPSGAESWGNAISSGQMTLEEAASAISRSEEAQIKGVVPFAKGGIITKPTLGMIGEAGDAEGVFPIKNPNDPFGITSLLSVMDNLVEEVSSNNAYLSDIRDNTQKERTI